MTIVYQPVEVLSFFSLLFTSVDDNRLVLSDPDATGSDYINASFVGVRKCTHTIDLRILLI